MFIETDLKRIEQIAAEKEDENWEFRVFLKQLDMPRAEIDALVHQINEDVTYPHLHKDNFVSRLWGVLGNYAVCPIVFNVYERLKIG